MQGCWAPRLEARASCTYKVREFHLGVWGMGLQRSQLGEPHVWAAKRGLRVPDVVQQRRRFEPCVLPQLENQLSQLVISAYASSVAVQRSGCVVGVEGNQRRPGAEEEGGLTGHQRI